jgi:hypothetical protein
MHGPRSRRPADVLRWLILGSRDRFRAAVVRWTPDHVVQARQFHRAFGRPIDWRRPTTFNEKIHWIRRYERSPLLPQLADKVAVRRYVEERLGPGVLTDLIGTWDRPEVIPWATLPTPCVLKMNWGSRMNLFLWDQSSLDVPDASAQLDAWRQCNFYWHLREWAYKDIPPLILGERMLLTTAGEIPPDYKLFCFDGVPRLVQVDFKRFTQHTRALYRLPWEFIPVQYRYPVTPNAAQLPPPPNLQRMIDDAATLGAGLPFVRADFYDLGDRVVFGELTWYPEAGCGSFSPAIYDAEFGQWLPLRRIGEANGHRA